MTTLDEEERDVVAIAEALPDVIEFTVTADDLANGVPGVPFHCALAVALRRQTGTFWGVTIEQCRPDSTSRWYAIDERSQRQIVRFDTNRPVAPFSGTATRLQDSTR